VCVLRVNKSRWIWSGWMPWLLTRNPPPPPHPPPTTKMAAMRKPLRSA
jgi:hypothetical protein